MKRRGFIQKSMMTSAALTLGKFPLSLIPKDEVVKLTILHTNDVHSRVERFPNDGSRNAGAGGAAERAALIKDIRKRERNVLLLDAGDIFQGTPYFNFFGGELEFKLMSALKYDAATMGNHDFDGGIDGFHKQLPLANFPFVVSNYDFRNTVLNGKIKEHLIFEKEGIKIGVLGVGIELAGLVPKNLVKEMQYLDPISNANRIAKQLKNEEKCDLVICLSHLGFKYRGDKVSDHVLAENSEDIDIIIGGHTHTFLDQAVVVQNKKNKSVLINQAGWAGILLGRIDVFFEKGKGNKCESCN
ncbi:MAG: metallophosphatase, partial [Bacteroidota bacterium]